MHIALANLRIYLVAIAERDHKMRDINKGETLFVPVDAGEGAFAGECLITIETIDGPVSGFIRSSQVVTRGDVNFVPAEVMEIDSDQLTIRLHGSFFTTTGIAHISSTSNFERAA